MPIQVAGVLAVEDEPTGDGRLFTGGSFQWDGILPIAIIWDRDDGDHSGATLGSITSIERRDNGVIWGEGELSESEDPETQAAVLRVQELLEEGAVGVSLRFDSQVCEIRVKRELIELDAVEEASADPPDLEEDEDGERIIVARYAADDVLEVTTSCRVRHLAIVDTAAMVGARISIAASGAITASALAGDWSGREWMFDDPQFGEPSTDSRLRYDPDRGLWSCPPTLTDDGHYFGHVTPMGICLRGRPDRCLTPPDGDLEGFMRGRAPAAGGRRTGVVTLSRRHGNGHCSTGVGILEATKFYDGGWGGADVRVGRDRYGIWFSGMARPGIAEDDAYKLCACDVSGHWEYPLNGVKTRATLVGLPAVDVGGFPKGYLTHSEFMNGLAASAGIDVEEGCVGSWASDEVDLSVLMERIDQIGVAVGELYAAHIRGQDE